MPIDDEKAAVTAEKARLAGVSVPLLDAGPVLRAANSGSAAFIRKYVADVTLVHRNQELLRLYQTHARLLEKVRPRWD